MFRRSLLSAIAVALVVAPSVGCEDKGKLSEAAAAETVDVALELVERDVGQIRKGMPEGLKVLQKRMPADPLGSRQELQEAIKAARSNVDELAFAKSTFFSFASPEGVVLRSEIDPDRFVDQNVLKAFPALSKGLEPNAGLVEAFGELDALRGVKRGPDLAWVVALGVPGDDGKARGLFLTGWSMRLYARSLQEQVRAKLLEKAKEKGQKAAPLVYVYVLKGQGAYGDPDAPDANAETLAKLGALEKAKGGSFVTIQEIDKRLFGIAAKPAKGLGEDAAVAVVASVY